MLYFLITKDQALSRFVSFRKMITNQLNTHIKCFQSDNGGEFISFRSYFENHGIVHRFSYNHTPQQNGRAERKIRHVIEIGLALFAQASLPSKFLLQAFHNATYLINSFLPKFYLISLQLSFFLTSHQIMLIFAFLDFFASLPYGLICEINFP